MKRLLLEMEILFILATQSPPKQGWYLSLLYRRIRQEFSQIIFETRKEFRLGTCLDFTNLKFRLSKSQVDDALNNLSNYGLIEIRKGRFRERAPVSLNFWGLIQILYYIFQRNPVNNLKLSRLLREVAANNTEKLCIFQEWNQLDSEYRKTIIEGIREYFRFDQKNQSKLRFLDKKTCMLKDPEDKEIISKIAYKDFVGSVLLKQNRHPSIQELRLRETLLKKPAELIAERAKVLSLTQCLKEKKEEFISKTKRLPLFSNNINFLMHTPDAYSLYWIAKASFAQTIHEGYQTWVSMSLILLLEPTQFETVDEKHARTIAFFKSKNSLYEPNFAFYSNKIKAWIEFGFGMVFAYPKYKYPNIWMRKLPKEKVFTFDYFSEVVLMETKEKIGYVDKPLLKQYFNTYRNGMLFLICWCNGNSGKKSDSKIHVLNVGLNNVKLLPIINTLAQIS
jgi:hypothetical protein